MRPLPLILLLGCGKPDASPTTDPGPRPEVASLPVHPVAAAKPGVGRRGVRLRGGDTSKPGRYVTLRMDGDSFSIPWELDQPKAIVAIDADPGVELWVPGAKLRHGDSWTIDLLDAATRAKLRTEPSYEITYPIEVEIHRGKEVEAAWVVIDMWAFARDRFEPVRTGAGFAFPIDAASRSPRDTLALMRTDDPTGTQGFGFSGLFPEDRTLAQVDVIAYQRPVERNGGACWYVDSAGKRESKQRYLTDQEVAIFDRRTGKPVTKRVFQAPTPPCPRTIMSDEFISTAVDAMAIERWVAAQVSGAAVDPAPRLLPPLGGTVIADPEAKPDANGDPPSTTVVLAKNLGLRNAEGTNLSNVLDSASGNLGDEAVRIVEFRIPPPPKGGSSAGQIKGKLGVVAVVEDHADPALSKKLVDAAFSRAPDIKGMLTAAGRPPWKPYDAENLGNDPELNIGYLGMVDMIGDAFPRATVYVYRFDRPSMPDHKHACRADARHVLCVEVGEGDPKAILSNVP